ncbi:MAG: proton-conducting transporter membrane subunit, partial [Methylophilaceae bacterium]
MPLLVLAWWVSNLLLCRIMLHKSEWSAAKASAHLALKNFTLGAIALASAVAILGWSSGTWQISALKFSSIPTMAMAFSGVLILIAALSQSAIWPFHRWLLSSLNSPTPVSALMHAGLVNGGGFLIARFAFVFLEQAWLMQWVFI